MSSLEHPAVVQVAGALRAAGLDAAAAGIRVLPDDVRTAAAAAAALGVEVGAIANSLVFRASGKAETVFPVLALTSGAHRADTGRLAELAGATEVGKADPAFVREHTGQAIGGVAPVGHPKPVPTLVDNELDAHPVVWAAAGHPKTVFPTTFTELLDLTGGTAADVTLAKENSHP